MERNQEIQLPYHSSIRFERACFYVILGALIIGTLLSIMSALKICSEACAAGHSYRLYGFTFETIGLTFFIFTSLLHLLSRRYHFLKYVVLASLATSVGAEGMFIYAQKYIIGHWCPLCLSIAGAILLAFIFSALNVTQHLAQNKGQKGVKMKQFFYSTTTIFLMAFGFFFAQFGFTKFSKLQAAEQSVKEKIAFGDLKSPVEVYVVSDWECGACRKIEPVIINGSERIMKEAKLIFIDFAVHQESLDFTPYNISFMLNNKPQYFKLREELSKLSLSDEPPTEEQIEKLAKELGTTYKELNFSEVSITNNFFNHIVKQFSVESTPTVIIVNTENKKGKKLKGAQEITMVNILSAIEALKKG